ncbi:hypothetical protein C2C43_25865 [Escherichia coli]|nr:hypothetical protein [Escherichia coli]
MYKTIFLSVFYMISGFQCCVFVLEQCYKLFNCCYLVKKIVNNHICSIKLHGNIGGEAGDYRCSFRL